MNQIKPEQLDFNPFDKFGNQTALVCARKDDKYNMCTIAWGTIGKLWSRNVAIVYVKPIRFTDRFLKDDDYFTITFLNEEHKNDLIYCGTKSGKHVNKMNIPTLKPIRLENGITFEGYETVFVLKKIYVGKFKKAGFHKSDEIINHYYSSERPHNVYIGEIVDIIQK